MCHLDNYPRFHKFQLDILNHDEEYMEINAINKKIDNSGKTSHKNKNTCSRSPQIKVEILHMQFKHDGLHAVFSSTSVIL